MTSNMTCLSDYIACPDCDYLLEEIDLSEGKILRCPRCGSVLRRSVRNSLQKAVALSSAGLIVFVPAVTLPIMTFTVAGLKGTGNVVDAMLSLCEKGFYFVGLMVLLVSVLFPLLKLGLLFIVSIALLSRRVSGSVKYLFRLYQHLSEWGMVEVYMLGILVAIIKMYSMAAINYNTGFFCFSALVVLTVWSSAVIDEHLFWDLIEKRGNDHEAEEPIDIRLLARSETARDASLIRCPGCGKISLDMFVGVDETQRCPRCRAALHSRKPRSLNRTWALVLAAGIFYLPANILPMMRVNFMGKPDDSTILDGIIYFFQSGEYLVGTIILTASVLVPLFKIIGIILILFSVHFRWSSWLKHKTLLFRMIEFIGRWSFLDVFVIALLGAMVRFGSLTTIEADPAAPFFTAVVVCTMFAALTFDPRIIWDTGVSRKRTEG